MDPITAFQVAASVITFVEFSRVLLSNAYTVYKSPTGQTTQVVQLETVGEDLRSLRTRIEADISRFNASEYDHEILVLCRECSAIGKELQATVDGLKRSPRGSSRLDYATNSFALAAKGLWMRGQVEELNEKLDTIRSRIMLCMIASIWHDTKSTNQSETETRQKLDAIVQTIDTKLSNVVDVISQIGGIGQIDPLKPFLEREMTYTRDPSATVRVTQALADHLWASNWYPGTQGIDSASLPSSEMFMKAIIASLSFPSMTDRRELIPKAYANTFEWIFKRIGDTRNRETIAEDDQTTGFPEWLESDHKSIYWITGKPGSGKSTLMKYLINHPSVADHLQRWARRRNLPPLWAGYYFWDAGSNPLQKSRVGMLQTLLHECFQQRPDLVPLVFPRRWALYTALGSTAFTPPAWTWSELSKAFARLTARSGKDFRLAIFLDGLDEFDGEPSDIISLIKNINAEHVKVCVASRPWTEFRDALLQSPSLTMQNLTKSDTLTYIHGNFKSCIAFQERERLSPELSAQLIKEIAVKANGVFLWVFIVVRTMIQDISSGRSLEELREILLDLPQDIYELYTRIWRSLEPGRMSGASKIFQIKVASIDIILLDAQLLWLTDGEMLPEGTDSEILAMIRPILTRKLDTVTRGVLEISRSGVIEFLHRTASDWVKHPETWRRICESAPPDFDASLSLLEAANVYKSPKISFLDPFEASSVRHGPDEQWYSKRLDGIADLAPIFQILTLAGNVADTPKITPKLVKAMDDFNRDVFQDAHPTCYSVFRPYVQSSELFGFSHSDTGWVSPENCFVGLTAYFAIVPYVREKMHLHPEIVEQKSVRQLSLLESALCGFQSLYLQKSRQQSGIRFHDVYKLNTWVLPKRRLELIKLILDAGASTGAVAHMRLFKGPPSSVRQLSLDVLEMTRQTRDMSQIPASELAAFVRQQTNLRDKPDGPEFSPEDHQYWADMTELITGHTSSPAKRLLSKSKLWWARCQYLFSH